MRSLIPQDHDPRWLPDPIPASFYARGEAPPWVGWTTAARGLPMPSRNVLAIGAVALVGLVLVVGLARIAGRGAPPAPLRIAQAAPSQPASAPGTPPSDEPTPFVAAPTPSPTATPSPTPTPRSTSTPSPTPVTIPNRQIRASRGGQATLVAITAPGTACTIAVAYTPPPQVGSATSNGSGTVTWTWPVSAQVRPGTYQILVTCGSGTAGATITVR